MKEREPDAMEMAIMYESGVNPYLYHVYAHNLWYLYVVNKSNSKIKMIIDIERRMVCH